MFMQEFLCLITAICLVCGGRRNFGSRVRVNLPRVRKQSVV
jgi:hypothetical protein